MAILYFKNSTYTNLRKYLLAREHTIRLLRTPTFQIGIEAVCFCFSLEVLYTISMENMQPSASMEVVHNKINPNIDLEQESHALAQEQVLLAEQQEDIADKDSQEMSTTKEILLIRMEEVRLRITQIEQEKKKKQNLLTKFLDRYMIIKDFIENPVEQMRILVSEKLLDALPEETLKVVKSNYEKFHFIDYKLVEEALETDVFSKELAALNLELAQGAEQMTVFENQEKIKEEQTQTFSLENENVAEKPTLENIEDTGIIQGESSLEDVPFKGKPFEVIKGGVSNNDLEVVNAVPQTVEDSLEIMQEVNDSIEEGVGAIGSGLSNAA